ncbi:MAG: hypothetical protein WC700_09100 [Gemmatimonadaceae bacterium]|jgi:hypothetical protein
MNETVKNVTDATIPASTPVTVTDGANDPCAASVGPAEVSLPPVREREDVGIADEPVIPEWKRVQAECEARSRMGRYVKPVHASERKKNRAAEATGRQTVRKMRKIAARRAKAERLAPVVRSYPSLADGTMIATTEGC